MYIESLSVLSLDCVCIESFEPALNLYGFCAGICVDSGIESGWNLYWICIESVLHLY